MSQNNSMNLTTSHATSSSLSDLAKALFTYIGEDPNREGLKKTPERFAKAFMELTQGYSLSGRDAISEGIFESESSGPVAVNGIEFFSLCEHHILPFWGRVSVAYLPNDKILGLSKIARVVDVFSKRLQVQERLTCEIAECIKEVIHPKAVVVTIEAQHMCMMMRGVEKIASHTKTEFLWKSDEVSSFELDRLLAQIKVSEKGI